MLPFTILLLLIFFSDIICIYAQQSAAGQDTLIGIIGRDFIMMGADSSSSGGGGIALTSCSVDKLAVIHDGLGLSDVRSSNNDVTSSNNRRESMKQQAVAIGFAGDVADADRLLGTLRTHAQVKEYEAGIGNDVQCVFDGQAEESSATTLGSVSPSGLDAEAIANLSRNQIASRMRSRTPLQLCLLVGGMVRCNNNGGSNKSQVQVVVDNRVQKQISAASASYIKSKSSMIDITSSTVEEKQKKRKDDSQKISNPYLTPKLFWLDQYGSIQSMKYAAHGYASNFAYSILDQRYRTGMTREESIELIRECFEQLRQRYVINSPQPPRIKCIDRYGVTEIIDDSKTLHN